MSLTWKVNDGAEAYGFHTLEAVAPGRMATANVTDLGDGTAVVSVSLRIPIVAGRERLLEYAEALLERNAGEAMEDPL